MDQIWLWQRDRREALFAALGLKGTKLPQHGVSARPFRDGMLVYLQPIGAFGAPKPSGRVPRRMEHRIYVICTCGKHIPSGRMLQHLRGKDHK